MKLTINVQIKHRTNHRQKIHITESFISSSEWDEFARLLSPSLNLVPRAFPLKVGGAGKDPGIGWSRVHLTP